MTIFWIAAVVLLLIACALLARPLLWGRARTGIERERLNIEVYREQLRDLDAELASGALSAEAHASARTELESRLLEDTAAAEAVALAPPRATRAMTAALVAFVAVGAVAVYFAVGTPHTLDRQWMARAAVEAERREFEAMVDGLAERLRASPEDGHAWAMLARSYKLVGRLHEAAHAYAQALARIEPDAGVLANYADVLARLQGSLDGEPEKLIARALERDPMHPLALAIAGSAAFQKNDFAGAARYWERMLVQLPPDSQEARAVRSSIAEARTRAEAAASMSGEGAGVAARAAVSGWVSLAPALADQVQPDDSVFIYARAEGSRTPLAVVRREARELPFAFTLDDAHAMVAGSGLSSASQIVVAARISKSANAARTPGDLESAGARVANNARGVKIVIDSVVR